jgi:agmatinase
VVASLASKNIVPISIGGDHSITTEVVKGLAQGSHGEKFAILYFDAHPDFVSSTLNYYGSVLTDCKDELNFAKSALVGTRAAEQEELENAKTNNLLIISPLDISEGGLSHVANQLKSRVGRTRKYISIDLDCLDPAFAPGVSLPSPCGLSAAQLIYLLKKLIASGNVAGLDLVELSPDYDIQNSTAGLAAKILSECIASFRSDTNQR